MNSRKLAFPSFEAQSRRYGSEARFRRQERGFRGDLSSYGSFGVDGDNVRCAFLRQERRSGRRRRSPRGGRPISPFGRRTPFRIWLGDRLDRNPFCLPDWNDARGLRDLRGKSIRAWGMPGHLPKADVCRTFRRQSAFGSDGKLFRCPQRCVPACRVADFRWSASDMTSGMF